MKKLYLFCWLIIVAAFRICSTTDLQHIPTCTFSLQQATQYHQPALQQTPHLCGSYKHRNSTSFANLHNYNADQLQKNFNYHQYSEHEILNQESLYLSDEFLKLAKSYPGYEQAVEQLHHKLQKYGLLQKIFYTFKGNYSPGLTKRIHRLYQEIQRKKAAQSQQQQQHNHIKHSFDNTFAEYSILKPVYEQYCPSLAQAIEKRISAAQHSINQLQHTIYQESLDIRKKTNLLPSYSILYPHQKSLIDCSEAIHDYNSEGLIDKAMYVADFCWTLLDYGQAIAEGAALGLYATAQDFIEHPIEATVCMIAGKQVLGYQLCKVLYNVADIGLTAITDFNHAKEKWDEYIAPLSNLIAAIENKEITLRDSLKTGTALVVGYKAQTKLLGGLGKFCTTVKQQATRFAQNNVPSFTVQQYLATPEGYLLRGVAKSTCPANCPNQYEHLKQWLRIKEFTSIIKTSKHGIERLIERNFTPEEVRAVMHTPTFIKKQKDGAFAYIKQIGEKFNVIIFNQQNEEVITVLKHGTQKKLTEMGKNYGW